MINITYSCKDLNEVKELLLFQKENKLIDKVNLDLNKPKSEEKINEKKVFCEKCGNEKRLIKGGTRSDGTVYGNFYTCDSCNPRKDGKFQNSKSKIINNNPDSIFCPECGSFIKRKTSEFGDYYKCNCGYKLDSRSDDFKNLIKENEY